jgi:hypothetical protein
VLHTGRSRAGTKVNVLPMVSRRSEEHHIGTAPGGPCRRHATVPEVSFDVFISAMTDEAAACRAGR